MVHFGINAPRAGKSMVYNKCVFCDQIYATNARGSVCDECAIIFSWVSGMNYLAALNRVSELIRTTKVNSKMTNENYCKKNFGTHAAQAIMAIIIDKSYVNGCVPHEGSHNSCNLFNSKLMIPIVYNIID